MRLFGKIRHRWNRWRDWKQYSHFGPVKNFLIFLHIIRCGWFEQFNDWRKD